MRNTEDNRTDSPKSFSVHMLMLAVSLLLAQWMVFLFVIFSGRSEHAGYFGIPAGGMAAAGTLGFLLFLLTRKRFGEVRAFALAGLFLFVLGQGVSVNATLEMNPILAGVRRMMSLPILGFILLSAFGKFVKRTQYSEAFPNASLFPGPLGISILPVAFSEAARLVYTDWTDNPSFQLALGIVLAACAVMLAVSIIKSGRNDESTVSYPAPPA